MVMDYAHKRNGAREKRSEAPPEVPRLVSWDVAPFKLAEDCVKAARAVHTAKLEYHELHEKTAEEVDTLMSPFQDNPVKKSILSDKTGSLMQNRLLANMAGGMVAGAGLGSDTDPVDDVEASLSSPAHENELQQIQARAMLQDLMLNDEIISGHEHGDVLNAYNEIAQLSPRAATQPAVIRPLLRKRLSQSSIEPFEAGEMATIEKTLGQTQQMPQN